MRRRVVAAIAVTTAVVSATAALFGFGVIRLPSTTPTVALGPPHFVEELTSGVDQTYDGPYPLSVGGGVAVLDCNGDGKPDMYIAGGSNPAALYRNDSPIGGALKFTRRPDPATDLTDVVGAYPIDVDGDGQVDLAILRIGGLELLRGLGDCRFEPANARWAFDGGSGFVTAFSATWETTTGLPTIAVGRYLKLDASGKPTFDCSDNALVRPNAAGTGYAPPIPLTPGFCTLSMLFSDWDRSGRRALRVSNDRQYYDPAVGQEQLWRVSPSETPRLYTADDGWVPVQLEGMGIASYDVTGDGYPDVFLTSQGASRLQTLTSGPAKPTYRDIGLPRGVNSAHPFMGDTSLPSTAWHPEFQDVNNDGFIDLLISKGNVDAQPDYAQQDASDLFIGQPDGTFVEGAAEAGFVNLGLGRGAALADFNLDGLLDLVLVNHGAPARIWRNVGSGDASRPGQMGGWLGIELDQSGPDRDAIGAWVEVKVGDMTLRREVTIGGGHAGGELGWIHFGLGAARDADVRVQWPDGTLGPWQHVTANQFVTIERGAADVRPWSPPTN